MHRMFDCESCPNQQKRECLIGRVDEEVGTDIAKTIDVVQTSADAVVLVFDSVEDVDLADEMLAGVGLNTGVDYVVRKDDDHGVVELTAAIMMRFGADSIGVVIDALSDDLDFRVVAMESAADLYDLHVLAESGWFAEQNELTEANPYHDAEGHFSGVEVPGSWSLRGKQRKVKSNKSGSPQLSFTKVPCGRAARKQGRDIRCQDGKVLSAGAEKIKAAFAGKKRGRLESINKIARLIG